jgi:lipopolysaccharide transport system ATP-binding protein
MSSPIITVEQLGKKYRIHRQHGRHRYVALRDVIAQRASQAMARLRGAPGSAIDEDFWALQDLSFEVSEGDVLGIIGRNGAGKSTLLKILSRITEPTTGRVTLRGRVASLLEVGTGFHPELSGRENVFLNGTILGMSRREVARKFDEIVAFAEVEQFLDTPVKHYSTGMYMRLAFAVAAHLDSEILVIDEVLAVGDAEFQRKCLGKMDQVARSGRTVLFVSHNLNAVETLCTSALCLSGGRLREHGRDVRRIINTYLSAGDHGADQASEWRNPGNALDHPVVTPLHFAIVDAGGRPIAGPARSDDRLYVEITADVKRADPAFNIGFSIFDQDSRELLWSLTTDGPEARWPRLTVGRATYRCPLPARFFNEGHYRLELNASLHCREWIARPGHGSPTIYFEIRGGLSDSPYWTFARPGILAPEWNWERLR